MALKISIKGWRTAPSGTHLCESCRHCTIIKGHSTSESYFCSFIDKRINQKVVECSSYMARGTMTLHEMAGMAWVLEHKKGKIGFTSAKEYNAKHGWGSSIDFDD